VIEVKDLTKELGGRTILAGATFNVTPGSIVGLLGPNGAGKTTTIRILAGALAPSSGTARIAGYDLNQSAGEVRKLIGYLPEVPPLYPEMRVIEYLRFIAALRTVPRAKVSPAIDLALELCGLHSVQRRLCGQLSRGFKQRVGIAQAILHSPPVLLLDEPTNGLDPLQLVEFRRLIERLRGKQTILLSTHLLSEVEESCTDVVFFSEGRTVGQFRTDPSVGRRELAQRYFELVAGRMPTEKKLGQPALAANQ
jgi:ABC-2 type transport system ATP-binding protein